MNSNDQEINRIKEILNNPNLAKPNKIILEKRLKELEQNNHD
ncbi:hypothetical protein [endosymbiont GvMRE of Glomus versiforme]|nr:hypothetical protein [endosymbiont GvMRE of Glomus versiforme]RHZ36281.1 hypothetical protein GvMRE_Ic1g65 [endosymbiont GvMRE of Glomus versiforme]RHZ37483.1 hypothetical protein GvMRE_I1g707 [endosymbiont GvMRE of Glomus versiforme]